MTSYSNTDHNIMISIRGHTRNTAILIHKCLFIFDDIYRANGAREISVYSISLALCIELMEDIRFTDYNNISIQNK